MGRSKVLSLLPPTDKKVQVCLIFSIPTMVQYYMPLQKLPLPQGIAGPTIWNSLPDVISAPSVNLPSAFKNISVPGPVL